VELDPDAFNAFLGGVGQDVLWRRASMCPCRDPITGSPRQGCPVCGNRGVIWDDPVTATVGVTSMRVKREWAAFGLWESGDEILTIPSDSPLYACGERDRVVMIDSSEPFQAVLMKGTNDRLLYPVVEIDRAFCVAAGAVVDLALPAVQEDGTVVWAAGEGPDAGVQYSLRGRKHQEYYMLQEIPKDRAHFHGAHLPRLCQFRRFDLFGRVAGRP
jgi:hypothetical protein